MLRQKRRAVSPYKRSDNCNGVGGNLANRYANRFQSVSVKYQPKQAAKHETGPAGLLGFSPGLSYALDRFFLNKSVRLVTRRTSDQARKGKNCQREIPGLGFMLGCRQSYAKDHERAAAATGQAGIAVVIDGPSRRPRRASDLHLAPRTLHTDARTR